MKLFRLSQAAVWLDARMIGPDVDIASVGTDTRTLAPGQLFVALVGPRFDAHDFAGQAAEKGAAALLVSRELPVALPQILVSDTRDALGRLAAAWRGTLKGRVVALTGSNGKTSTKEMIAAILGRAGRTAATRGNLNNDIGLPLTLLAARDEDYLVLEMGANHAGEIAYLTAIARPEVSLITNAGRAHLEGFGSLEGVARAKGEIIMGLGPEGTFLLNADDVHAPLWRGFAGTRRILSFGIDRTADVMPADGGAGASLNGAGFHATYRIRTPRGVLEVQLGLAGRHNLSNALAAVAMAEALEVGHDAVREGLASIRPVPGRLRPLTVPSGARVIDDAYNANPESVGAALDVLRSLPGRRWLVLGDLAELGAGAADLHREIGLRAREARVERLWAVGPLCRATVKSFGAGGRHFPDREALVEDLMNSLGEGDVVLVKGSRSAAMDQVVEALSRGGEG